VRRTLRVERLREHAALPGRAYEHDAGLDLVAAEPALLAPGGRATVPCGIAVWVWVRVKHQALMEAHAEHSKGLEHLLKALDPDEDTDNMLDRIADKVDEETPGGVRAILDALEKQPKEKT